MIFTVLLYDEAEEIGVSADWTVDVALTAEMLAGTNCHARTDIARQGPLAKPLNLGQQTISAGNAVFMDGFGTYFIES